jgi:Arabinose-binding domain of AraC transcription regulator, N-term
MDLRDAGIFFNLAASSATVKDAADYLVQYAGAVSEAIRLDISRQDGETVLTARPVLVFDEPHRQFSEFLVLSVIRMLQRATNRDFAPQRVTFAHARNSGLREIHRILRCPAEFAHTSDSWGFPQSVMELPIVSRDSRLPNLLQAHAEDLLSERRIAVGLRDCGG